MPVNNGHTKILIGISSCLIGEKVRFDGGHKQNRYILDTLGHYFSFRPFCPELAIGLGVPRESIRLVDDGGAINAVGSRREDLNVTDALIQSAHDQRCWQRQVFGYIVKKDSPSCGMERVKVYRGDHPQRSGAGLYTATMMQNFPTLPVEEEGRLGDPVLRESFVKRVFIYRRWHEMLARGLDWAALTDFHARHKLILYSHDQALGRRLGRELSEAHREPVEEYADRYLVELMRILRIYAKRSNHVNVLEHVRGYLKHDLDQDDKRELTESIENYRLGLLPLIVPITLLRHHFRKNPNEYIERSYYMRPHPDELMLLNSL
ncbi:MAG: DUF523 and DUF1722 domain-containing protein [Gammaproteobacteria bacterium]|nr:DUF523 and DUF1722 domain-containing protein [Gammaproteobacteria bacterium]MDH3446505.1 DUF523 and DUF1722 domain-containing protein [Gammaproteobacteria bacterium]